VHDILLPALTEYLGEELGYNPQIFIDFSELSSSNNWSDSIRTAIEKTKIFLFVLSDLERNNDINKELIFAEAIQKTVGTNIIVPVLFRKNSADYDDLPESIKQRRITDLSDYTAEAINSSRKLNAKFADAIEKLSASIADSIRKLNDSGGVTKESGDNLFLEIESLAYAYENIRRLMPSSDNRTRLMQDIVEKMKLKAEETTTILPELISSSSPGKRLAAIAALQEKPKLDYLDWLAEHVGNSEKPFVGYHASVSLYTAARSLGTEYKERVSQVLDKAIENLYKYDYKDPNQISVLNAAKTELGFKL